MTPPRLLAVSDLATLPVSPESWLATLVGAGVDGLWLRERAMSDRDLLACVARCRAQLPRSVRLLVSDRVDVALAGGADGVHLAASGLPARPIRNLAERLGLPLIVGRSTHNLREILAAQAEGADYVTFGPVFATPSKASYGPPRGLDELRAAVATGLPVVALGGVSGANVELLRTVAVAGVAAIRAFQTPGETAELARAFRPDP